MNRRMRSVIPGGLLLSLMFGAGMAQAAEHGAVAQGGTGAHERQTSDEDGRYAVQTPTVHVYATRLDDASHTAGKISTKLKDTPGSLTIVNTDEIERLGVYNLTDALEYNAGITVAPRGYDNLYNFSKIRGFDVSQNNISINGMKAFHTTDNLLSPELYGVDRVEVLRGPSSTGYGSAAVGGRINLELKRPQREDFNEVQVQVGNHKEKMLAVDINRTSKDRSLYGRFVAMVRGNDLFYDNTDQTRIYIAPSFTKSWGDRTKLTFFPFWQKDKIDGYAYSPRTRLPSDPLYGIMPDRFFIGVPGWDRYELEQQGISYELEHKFNKQLSFHQKVGWRKTEITSYQSAGAYMPIPGIYRRFGAMIDSEATAYFSDQFIQLHRDGKTGPSDTIFGFDWRYENTSDKEAMRILNMWTLPQIRDYVGGALIPADPDTVMPMDDLSYWSRERGFYVMHTQKVGRFTLSGGVRRGLYAQYSQRDDERYSQGAWTGQAGVVYDAGRGFHPYLHWNNSFEPSAYHDVDGKLLGPTTGQEWELGVHYIPRSTVQVTASIFDLRHQNLPRLVPATTYYTTTGEITSQGFELEGRAALNSNLRLLGSYTYLDNCVTKDTNPRRIGRKPSGVAMHSLNLRADAVLKKYDDGELTFGFGARYIGRRMDESNEISMGGVTLYDTSLSLARGDSSLTLHVRNLFDKKYVSNIESYWGTPMGFMGQERTFILSYIRRW